MFKKFSVMLFISAILVALAGCGNSKETAVSASNKNKLIEASIADASFVLLGKDSGTDQNSSSKGILAVDLKVKNVSNDSINLLPMDDIKLYDGNEEVNVDHNLDSSDLGLDTSLGGSIGAGNTKTITVIYNIEKDKKYEIGLKPFITGKGDDSEELKLALDPKKYIKSFETLQDPAKALKAYIEAIYLNKDNPDYEKYVIADKEAVQKDAQKAFKDTMKGVVDTISDTDAAKYYQSYQSVTAEKSKIVTTTMGNAKGKAVVKLDYTIVPLENLYDKVDGYKQEYNDNSGDYNSAKAEKYALSKFASIVNSIDAEECKDPVEIKMVQKDGKWELDSSDYYSNDLSKIFAGGRVY